MDVGGSYRKSEKTGNNKKQADKKYTRNLFKKIKKIYKKVLTFDIKYSILISRKEVKKKKALKKNFKITGGRKMRAYIKENGIEENLKKGTLGEVKEYLLSNLNQLLDWLDVEENDWGNFEEMKLEIESEIKQAETAEEIEEAFEYVNKEMSWWGVFVDEE